MAKKTKPAKVVLGSKEKKEGKDKFANTPFIGGGDGGVGTAGGNGETGGAGYCVVITSI